MLLEMHAHTKEHSPCSGIGAVELVRAVMEKGLNGLLITDHHYLWPQEEIDELRHSAGVPDSFLLFSGQEVTTSDAGDVLVYGGQTSIGPGIRLCDLRRACPDAALVWAHPWRWRNRPTTAGLFNPDLDAIEVLNTNQSYWQNKRALREWTRLGFVGIGGTDVHGRTVGNYPTIFEDKVKTLTDVMEAIWADRCRPFLKTG